MDLNNLTAFVMAHRADLIARTMQHLELVALALLAATLVGLPAAVILRGNRMATSAFLGFAGIVQTVPSLALLSVMLPLVWTRPEQRGGGVISLRVAAGDPEHAGRTRRG